MTSQRFTVKPQEDGLSLLDMLCTRLRGSRRALKRVLDERRVFVNGRRVWMAKHRVEAGDRVEIPEWVPDPAAGYGNSTQSPRTEVMVLWEDDDYVVANKPAGMVTNESPKSVEALLRADRSEPGLRVVHRLDRDTTGCLWCARSDAAFEKAVELFRAHSVLKTYEAIVAGRFPRETHRITTPLDGQSAETRVEVSRSNEQASFLRLELVTGRTHQVRRHLVSMGFPLAGDKQYGASQSLSRIFQAIPRQMLHAVALESPHPLHPDRVISVRAPRPDDLKAALKLLGLDKN